MSTTTGICSSLPPWIINSGAALGFVKFCGSFAFSTFFHAGTLNGSFFTSCDVEMPPSCCTM